jgi:hypothetical protein
MGSPLTKVENLKTNQSVCLSSIKPQPAESALSLQSAANASLKPRRMAMRLRSNF